MERKDKGHIIENVLCEDLNAYFKYPVEGNNADGSNHMIRGVGYKDSCGKHKKLVKGKEGSRIGSLELDVTGLEDSFELQLKLKKMPGKKGIDGFKIFPGCYLGTTHHIEYQERGNKLIVVIHYEGGISNTSDKEHVDPRIEHPETSLNFDW